MRIDGLIVYQNGKNPVHGRSFVHEPGYPAFLSQFGKHFLQFSH